MRYAIISDIHANLEALTAVLARIDAERIDRIVCLGDIVGYFANPNECLAIIRERGVLCVAGNHDRVAAGLKPAGDFWETARRAIVWTAGQLTPENVQYLRRLRLVECVDDQFLIVHGALHPEPNDHVYLSSSQEARNSFDALIHHPSKAKLCFFGQTHQQAAYAAFQYGRGVIVEKNENSFSVEPDGYYLVNPGSVGQPRDGDPRASFLLCDAVAGEIRFDRVAYDRDASFAKARRAGLLDRDNAAARCGSRIVRTLHTAMERVMRA